MGMPPVKRGTRLNANLLNEIIAQANAGGRFDPGFGMIAKASKAGIQLSQAARYALMTEPAESVVVVNTGTTAIAAYSPAGIVDSVSQDEGELLNLRALNVRLPKAEDAGAFVITQDRLDPGQAGLAWCSGTCLVRLFRWFDSEVLESADIAAGERYCLATFDGSLDVVWSQRNPAASSTAPTTPIVATEHWAVVRFNGRRFLRWYNSGTTTVAAYSPIVPNVTDTDGIVSGTTFGTFAGILNCRAPVSADSVTMAYVNVGGSVEAGKYGRCTIRESLVRTIASYDAGATVGAVASQTGMSSSGSGFNLLARLGTYLSVQYAIAKPAGGSAQIKFIEIIDGQTVYSSGGTTYYGGTKVSGTATTVPSLYDPTISAIPGDFTATSGICRGTLIVNGVSTGTRVLVCHDTRSGNMITQALVEGDVVATSTTVALTLVSDSTQSVTAYLPLYQ
jgi:hypothetical protein